MARRKLSIDEMRNRAERLRKEIASLEVEVAKLEGR
jgi:hypothetical protein